MSTASYSLTDLPTELLLEITSHYPYPTTFHPFLSRPRDKLWQRQLQDRLQVLRSLSQSCSFLRGVFLPLLWERIHAHRTSFHQDDSKQAFVTHLFPYIKCVCSSISLQECEFISRDFRTTQLRSVHMDMQWHRDTREPVFRFVQFLCALPNLTSLQLDPVSISLVPMLSYALYNVSLSTVTTLQIQGWVQPIFPSFPHLKTLAFTTIYSGPLTSVKTNFLHLEALSGLRFSAESSLIEGKSPPGRPLRCSPAPLELLQDLPHLRAMEIWSPVSLESAPLFARLDEFTRLSELSVVYDEGTEDTLPLDAVIQLCINALHASESSYPKVLTVWHRKPDGIDVMPSTISLNS